MRSILQTALAVSLLLCCQAAVSQTPVNKPGVAASHGIVSAESPCGSLKGMSNAGRLDYDSYFDPYLEKMISSIRKRWYRSIPREAKSPTLAKGRVTILFRILPNGKVDRKDTILEVSTGYRDLNLAAWKAVTKSKLPPLPKKYKCPYLQVKMTFRYNLPPRNITKPTNTQQATDGLR